MIRYSVEELASGVFRVDAPDGTTFEHDIDSLPADIRDKLMLLRAVDIHTRIEGVGTRLAENLYWVSEDGGSDDDLKARMLMFLQRKEFSQKMCELSVRVKVNLNDRTYHVADTVTGKSLYIAHEYIESMQELT